MAYGDCTCNVVWNSILPPPPCPIHTRSWHGGCCHHCHCHCTPPQTTPFPTVWSGDAEWTGEVTITFTPEGMDETRET